MAEHWLWTAWTAEMTVAMKYSHPRVYNNKGSAKSAQRDELSGDRYLKSSLQSMQAFATPLPALHNAVTSDTVKWYTTRP